MSIAGGLPRALARGRAAGCGVVQIFLRSQLRWRGRALEPGEIREFKRERATGGFRAVVAHASYLINLAAPGQEEWRRAVDSLGDELERAEALDVPLVIVHAGSHRGAGHEAGVGRIARALDELAVRTAGWRVSVTLENTVGAGDQLGARAEDFAGVLTRLRAPERVRVCLDTCHLFAAGHDIRSESGFAATLGEFERAVGADRIAAFHLNDARAPLGSRLDRHAHIGRGEIGVEAFRWLLRHPVHGATPMILETPKVEDGDRRNLALLRRLRGDRRPMARAAAWKRAGGGPTGRS
jgi:deoxyribonuclease-4